MGAKDIINNAANNTGAVATQTQQKSVFGFMKDHKDQIAAALPKHMTADRMVRVATTCFRKVPKLLECTPESLFGAIIQLSQLGLEPENGLGHAYLIPFEKKKNIGGQWIVEKVEVQVIIGYKGLLDLARRSGNIDDINAFPVYECDTFELILGLKPDIIHKPNVDHKDYGNPDKIKFVYAVANLKGGGTQFRVMNRAQVERIRGRSKAKNNGPWMTDWEPMALKTVLRQLCGWLPLSVEVQQAINTDEAAERGSQFIFDPNSIAGESSVVEVPPALEDDSQQNAPMTLETVLLMIEPATEEDIATIQDLSNSLTKVEQMQVESELGKKFPDHGRQF